MFLSVQYQMQCRGTTLVSPGLPHSEGTSLMPLLWALSTKALLLTKHPQILVTCSLIGQGILGAIKQGNNRHSKVKT